MSHRYFFVAIILTSAFLANAVVRDVTSYGAIPNDTNSDRTAIQNAINDASLLDQSRQLPRGDVVYLPAGTYLVDGPIV